MEEILCDGMFISSQFHDQWCHTGSLKLTMVKELHYRNWQILQSIYLLCQLFRLKKVIKKMLIMYIKFKNVSYLQPLNCQKHKKLKYFPSIQKVLSNSAKMLLKSLTNKWSSNMSLCFTFTLLMHMKMSTSNQSYTGILHFIALYFFHFADTVLFKNWRFESTSINFFPTTFAHFVFLCHILVILTIFLTLLLLLYLL